MSIQTALTVITDTIYWFDSYLRDRTQSVKLNTFISKEANVDFGVPQGSILGPILFSVYVNDIAEYITESTLVQYADDTQFLHYGYLENIYNIIKKAEITLVTAKEYFLKNGFMINPSKTQCIFTGSRQLMAQIPDNISIDFDGTIIFPSTHEKKFRITCGQIHGVRHTY